MPVLTRPQPTGCERFMETEEVIVSKTDPKGRITYANEVFCRISGYPVDDLLGQPHNMIRHPEMPRGVFKLLWDRIRQGEEIFAYVINLCRNGDHYWVLAHVTPTHDEHGQLIGCHSNRRAPDPRALAAIRPLYARMLELEQPHTSPGVACQHSLPWLEQQLHSRGVSYDEFIFSLPYQED